MAKTEEYVDKQDMDSAEQARLKFIADTKKITERLEKFSGDLADIVILFAGKAHVPVTL